MAELELVEDLERCVSRRSLQVEGTPQEVAVNILIRKAGERLAVTVLPSTRWQTLFRERSAVTEAETGALERVIAECVEVWHENVVEVGKLGQRVFRMGTSGPLHNLPLGCTTFCAPVFRRLARAGQTLFREIFCPSLGSDSLQAIGDGLCELAKTPDLRVRITSRELFAPWGLMYLGPDDLSGALSGTGFWGYQHIIEHDPACETLPPPIFPPSLAVALHMDTGLDVPGLRPSELNRKLLRRYRLEPDPREVLMKEDLMERLRTGAPEHIFYFCCHGDLAHGALTDPRLQLTDTRTKLQIDERLPRETISASEIGACFPRARKYLIGRPLVFLNACEAGSMHATYDRGFASRFLNHHASAVIGPSIRMPIIFMQEFAERFFKLFFGEEQKGDSSGAMLDVGTILLRLRREYLKDHNPLGLTYSLYGAGDLMVASPVPFSEKTPPGD